MGATEPVYVAAGWSQADHEIAEARALYLAGAIDVDELERRIGAALEADA